MSETQNELAQRLISYSKTLESGGWIEGQGLAQDLADAAEALRQDRSRAPWDAWRNAEAAIASALAILKGCTSGEACVDRAIRALRGEGEK